MAKLSISNIAWAGVTGSDAVYVILQKQGFKYIDIASTISFQTAPNVGDKEVNDYKSQLAKYDLQILGMQSLTFNQDHLQLFGSEESRLGLIAHVKKMIDLAAKLGIQVIIFGSPKNRVIPEGITKNEAHKIAEGTLRELGQYALHYDIKLCLEPNPKEYGTNFINSFIEACEFIENSNLADSLYINFDTSTEIINKTTGDVLTEYLQKHVDLIGHAHISIPFLNYIRNDDENMPRLIKLLKLLKDAEYRGNYTIEMKTDNEENKALDLLETFKSRF
jgi:sugar phosphate isomerase/epimerase